MIFKITKGNVSLGGNTILENIDFEIRNKNEKVAIVGRNGCGKTTLLRLISGELESDSKDGVNTANFTVGNLTKGYLKQLTFEDNNRTLDEEIRQVFKRIIAMKERLSELTQLLEDDQDKKLVEEYLRLEEEFKECGGYYYQKEYDVMLKSFGFDLTDKAKKLSEFSGGERTKLAFIRLLLSKPDILLLDEPTNHLDINTIEWLEGYLKSYPHALVIVSHDRMFLDRISDTVYEIEHHHIKRYKGNYSDFIRQKRENYDKQLKDHNAQEKEIERLTRIAERFKGKPTKTAMAKSKLKAIEQMDIIDAPDKYDDKTFQIDFIPAKEPGKDILFVDRLAIGYDEILSQVSFEVKRGERVGIIGGNGLGKSTLLKTITGIIEPLSGSVTFGHNVEVGYFDQQMAQYTSEKSILDDFHDEFPNLTETEVRNSLGAFLFTQDDVYKEVSSLSGGEKVRLALCKIIKRRPNFLILDEPTNHMDIASKETLEEMLLSYRGTVIFVSHDRYFVKKTASKVLLIEKDRVKLYPFGYEQYEEEQEKLKLGDTSLENPVLFGSVISDPLKDGVKDKDKEEENLNSKRSALESYEASKEAAKRDRKIKKLEDSIALMEDRIEEKKLQLSLPDNATDYKKLSDIQEEIDELEEKLLELMEEWDNL